MVLIIINHHQANNKKSQHFPFTYVKSDVKPILIHQISRCLTMPLCHSGGEVSIIQNLFRCPTNGIAVLGAQMKIGDVVPQMTSYFWFYIYYVPLKSSEPFLCLVNRDEYTTRFEETLLEIHHWHHCVGQNHPNICMNWIQTNFSFLDPWSWTWTKTIKTMQILADIQGTCCMAVSTTSWSLRISNGALCNKALLLRTLPSLASEEIASLCSLYTYQFKVRSKYDKIGTKTKQQLIFWTFLSVSRI